MPEIAPSLQSFVLLELEAKSRELDLKQSVHDALWTLSTQWKLKEFEGEDVGSTIYTKVDYEHSRLTRYKAPNGSVIPYDQNKPMEAQVEQLPIEFNLSQRLQLGKYWKRLLKAEGIDSYYSLFVTSFAFTSANGYHEESSSTGTSFRSSVSGRSLDGAQLYDYIVDNSSTGATLSDYVGSGTIPSGDHSKVQSCITAFQAYVTRLYQLPSSSGDASWESKKLEYAFETATSDTPTGNQTVFKTSEYHGGALDWYSLNTQPGTTLTEAGGVTIDDDVQERVKRSVIPTEISFPGVRPRRIWQFQEGSISFRSLKPSLSGVVSMMAKQFLTGYSNDWSLMPLTLPVGSITEIKSIIARDVFGDDIYLSGLLPESVSGDTGWSAFKVNTINDAYTWDERLFIPPIVARSQEGQGFERVNLFRDQVANLVWGVEERVSDEIGGSIDGKDAALELRNYLSGVYSDSSTTPLPDRPQNPNNSKYQASFRYEAMSKVAENWVPFVPQKVTPSVERLVFRRATLPRVMDGKDIDYTNGANYVHPRTSLLREGLDLATPTTYDINDEEIPRSGTILEKHYQRCRWVDGQVYLWLSAKRTNGRGENLSGHGFDRLKPEAEI